MFKFNFGNVDNTVDITSENTVITAEKNDVLLKDAKHIDCPVENYLKIAKKLTESEVAVFLSNFTEISFLESQTIIDQLEDAADIVLAESNHSDLIPAVYEGGFKLWECTQDLADYLTQSGNEIEVKLEVEVEEKAGECSSPFKNPNDFLVPNLPADEFEKDPLAKSLEGKYVCDLGCSIGILGIIALINKATKIDFQDYNEEVISKLTIPCVVLNCEERDNLSIDDFEKCAFYSGDWESLRQLTEKEKKYDVILTSETIYSPASYSKLLNFFKTRLADDGIVYLAAKSYYFGVLGNILDFCDVLVKDGTFSYETVWKSGDGLQREIISIKRN
ncbi:unnamed protein product [Diamesa serratosioi]